MHSFYPRGSELNLFLLCVHRFLKYGPIWQVAKVPEVAHIHSFCPRGSKLGLFLLYGQRFLRYGPVFKNAIFGHGTLQVAKVSEVAHIHSFYPRGSKVSLFLLYRQRFLSTGLFLKLPYLGMKFGKWSKFQRLHIYTLSTLKGRN